MKRAIAAAVIVAACFKSASELSPFPCAMDLTCPSGLGCVSGNCVAAAMDATCTSGNDPTSCGAAIGAQCSASVGLGSATGNTMTGSGSPIQPLTGACEVPCNPSCPAGRNCSSNQPDGVCFVDCTDGTACPSNAQCLLNTQSNRKLCVPAGVHCQGVVSLSRCTSQFCTARVNSTECSDNMHTCPLQSSCDLAANSCFCNLGRLAFQCANDMPCNGCTGGSYWCAPDVTTFSCKSDVDGATGQCKCWNGMTVTFSCNTSGKSCEDLCAGR
jgi:hypothetical protein